MFDERARDLMKLLIERNIHILRDLERQSGLTKRQIEYSLEKISEILTDWNVKPLTIINNKITLTTQEKDVLIKVLMDRENFENYTMNSIERGKYLFLLLFYYYEDYFSVNHFIDEFEVGKTTVLSDIKLLNLELAKNNIKINYSRTKGYFLSGNESDIRYYLMKQIIVDLSSKNTTLIYDYFISKNKLESYLTRKQELLQLTQKYEVSFVENRLEEFIYTLIFIQTRLDVSLDKSKRNYFLSAMSDMKEFSLAEDILTYYGMENESANYYLCAWILGISMGTASSETVDHEVVMSLVEKIAVRFESLSGLRFYNEISAIEQIYSHFRPAYYRLYFNLPIINPLNDKIRSEYNKLFLIVKETLKPIESLLDNKIPEDEISLLTMHFASLCQDSKVELAKKKVGLIVCPNGVGSSSIVYAELKALFPEISFIGPVETNTIDMLENSYDFIFSTVPNVRLFYTNKPVYFVSPIMDAAEKYRLITDVYSSNQELNIHLPNMEAILEVIEEYADIKNRDKLEHELYNIVLPSENNQILTASKISIHLCDIINPNLIKIDVQALDWEAAIRLSAAPLLKENYISRDYIETIVANTKKDGPFMVITKSVALPHARPADGVKKLGLSLVRLKQPVEFGSKENDPVKYVFCLAAEDNKKHLDAMAELVEILSDSDFYKMIDNAKSVKEIYDYIQTYSY